MRTKMALQDAIKSRNLEGVRNALGSGASPSPSRLERYLGSLGLHCRAPLVLAVETGDLPIVLELIRSGADCDQVGRDGFTALGLAVRMQLHEVAAALIRAGANVNKVMWKRTTALLFASKLGDLDLVRLLLDSGASPASVLDLPDLVVFRIDGSVLRELVRAGGTASAGIAKLLESNQALGDFERQSMGTSKLGYLADRS